MGNYLNGRAPASNAGSNGIDARMLHFFLIKQKTHIRKLRLPFARNGLETAAKVGESFYPKTKKT